MFGELCFALLKIRMNIQNMIRWLSHKFYVTKSVSIIDNGVITSVYARYMLMKILLNFKFIVAQKIFDMCCEKLDINSDTIQIVKNINDVDRYVIYSNKENKNIIKNSILFMEKNENNFGNITLPKNPIVNCKITECLPINSEKHDFKYDKQINNENISGTINSYEQMSTPEQKTLNEKGCTCYHDTRIDIPEKYSIDVKKLMMLYATETVDNHTIGNILLFNDIRYTNRSELQITVLKNGMMNRNKLVINDILNWKISDIIN